MAPRHRAVPRRPLLAALAALLAALAGPPVHGDPSATLRGVGDGTIECGWTPGFHGRDLDSTVTAMIAHDDGSGPALYATGLFVAAGAVAANRVARWDGLAWSALDGPAGNGVDGTLFIDPTAYALTVYDDGGGGEALVVGGDFTTAGGVSANGIAKWSGGEWSAFSGPAGNGMDGPVLALAVWDDGSGPALYAAGFFDTAGGVTVNGVAKWDGTAWSALSGPAGTGVNNTVNALAVYDDGGGPALYAGGHFVTAGGVTVNRVAKWDGTAWSALSGPGATGVSNGVNALAVYDDGGGPALYAGGSFTEAGGVTVHSVAKWNGSAWSALSGPAGTGTSSSVQELAVHNDGGGPALYAGGSFIEAGGVVVNGIARWDGTGWSALSGLSGAGVAGSVSALAVYDPGTGSALYAGGFFQAAGGQDVGNVARWNGAWSALSTEVGAGMDFGIVHALAVFDDGGGKDLYAGGAFVRAGETTVNRIARWNGETWSALDGPAGSGMDGEVRALAVFDDGGGPALYAGGSFTTAGGVTVNHVARWDGTEWSALPGPFHPGTDAAVHAFAVFDDGTGPALYLGGGFTSAGGELAFGIAKWDGSTWSALSGPAGNGTNPGAEVFALGVFHQNGAGALYAGGSFATAGGVPVNGIARWDGTEWSALAALGGTGVSGAVKAISVYEDGNGALLYVGGEFSTAGGVTANHVAMWDGRRWSALSGPAGTGTSYQVLALRVYDDVGGPSLHAGGDFLRAGGTPFHNVARWRGAGWSGLDGPSGIGIGPGTILPDEVFVSALAVWDDGGGPALYAGGRFKTAGGLASRNIARWLCTGQVFADGFESGDLSAWPGVTGGP
jgi:hypothetical protein